MEIEPKMKWKSKNVTQHAPEMITLGSEEAQNIYLQ